MTDIKMLLVLVAILVCGCKSNGPRPETSDVFPPRPNEFRIVATSRRTNASAKWPNEFVVVTQEPTTRFTLLCHEDSALPCFYVKAAQVLPFPERDDNFITFTDQPTDTQMLEIEKTESR